MTYVWCSLFLCNQEDSHSFQFFCWIDLHSHRVHRRPGTLVPGGHQDRLVKEKDRKKGAKTCSKSRWSQVSELEKCCVCVHVYVCEWVHVCSPRLQTKNHLSSLQGFIVLPKIFPEETNMMLYLVTLETQIQRLCFCWKCGFSDSNNGNYFDICLWRQLHRTKPENEM